MGNINSEQLSLLEQQLAASQAREKVLRDALEECYRQMVCLIPDAEIRHAESMARKALTQQSDDTALKAALASERERYEKAFHKMRNVAAGYSNHCEDNGSTRRLEREFTEAEEVFRALGD